MENEDLIVRISGQDDKVKAAFEEIEQRAKALGINTKDLEIKAVPLKLERDKVKTTQSTDVLAQVAGNEAKVEEFLAEVSEMAVNQFKLNPPSTNLLLTDEGNDE